MDALFCTVCCVALPSSSQQHSLTPVASASNKRAIEFSVVVINPEIELLAGDRTTGWQSCDILL